MKLTERHNCWLSLSTSANFWFSMATIILEGTRWETNGELGTITCSRSTVISCNAPKGTGHLLTRNSNAFDCEAVRGKYEKPKRVVIPASTIRFSVQPRPAKERQWNTGDTTSRDVWIKCKCGLSQKRSRRTCRFCGKVLRHQ